MTCYYTYATLTQNDHSDIAAISKGLTALGIAHTCNAQTVVTIEPLTLKQEAQINMTCDDWSIAGGKNLLSTPI